MPEHSRRMLVGACRSTRNRIIEIFQTTLKIVEKLAEICQTPLKIPEKLAYLDGAACQRSSPIEEALSSPLEDRREDLDGGASVKPRNHNTHKMWYVTRVSDVFSK